MRKVRLLSLFVLLIVLVSACKNKTSSNVEEVSVIEAENIIKDKIEDANNKDTIDTKEPEKIIKEEKVAGKENEEVIEVEKEQEQKTTTNTATTNQKFVLKVGEPYPSFLLKDVNGKEWNSEDLKGKVKVFNFWFTSCKPCRDEIPELNLLVKQFAYRDDVVFIAPTFESKSKIESYTSEHPFNYNIIPNELAYNKSVGVKTYPVHLIIDKNENVHTIVTQQYPTIKDIMANYIYNAIDGRANDKKFEN